MNLLKVRVENVLKFFYDSFYTITTGACLLSVITLPIMDKGDKAYVQIISYSQWHLLNLFQVLMTLSMITAFHSLYERRDWYGLAFVMCEFFTLNFSLLIPFET